MSSSVTRTQEGLRFVCPVVVPVSGFRCISSEREMISGDDPSRCRVKSQGYETRRDDGLNVVRVSSEFNISICKYAKMRVAQTCYGFDKIIIYERNERVIQRSSVPAQEREWAVRSEQSKQASHRKSSIVDYGPREAPSFVVRPDPT